MYTSLSISIKDFNDFKSACNHFGIEINNYQLELLKKYYEVLLEWNKRINLISRKEQNIIEKHFLDSIVFLPEISSLIRITNDELRTTILDIGSGGGFPAIPLAIMKQEWHFTLCESITKKAKFLEHLIKGLNLKNAEVINARVGATGRSPLQTKYDLITARAVGKLDELIKYSLPLLKKDGYLLAYKSKNIDDEIKNAEKLIEKNNLTLKVFYKEINGVTRKLVTLSHCEEGHSHSPDEAIS